MGLLFGNVAPLPSPLDTLSGAQDILATTTYYHDRNLLGQYNFVHNEHYITRWDQVADVVAKMQINRNNWASISSEVAVTTTRGWSRTSGSQGDRKKYRSWVQIVAPRIIFQCVDG